jgi:hypothetical protein
MDEKIEKLRSELNDKQKELNDAILLRGGRAAGALLAMEPVKTPNPALAFIEFSGDLILGGKKYSGKETHHNGVGGRYGGVVPGGLKKLHSDVLEITSLHPRSLAVSLLWNHLIHPANANFEIFKAPGGENDLVTKQH